MAKTWVAAHDEEKEDSGILVKTVKRGGDANRERVENMLCGGLDGTSGGIDDKEKRGPWLGGGMRVPSASEKKKGTTVLELGVGETRVVC